MKRAASEWTIEAIRAACQEKADDERREMESVHPEWFSGIPEPDEHGNPEPDEPEPESGPDYSSNPDDEPGASFRGPDSETVIKCLFQNMVGDAKLFVSIHKGLFIFDHAGQVWFFWAGHYWKVDTTGRVIGAVQRVVEVYQHECNRISWRVNGLKARAGTETEVDKLVQIEKTIRQRIQALQTKQRIRDVLELARSGPDGLSTDGSEWDSNPMLIGCENGVVDLTTGQHRPGEPTDMIKTIAPIQWAGLNIRAPTWEKVVSEIFPPDVVDYVQKLVGYSITGKVVHHILIICHGSGSNGKSLFFETLGAVLGELSYQIPSETLLASAKDSGGGQSRSDIMALRGRRLCYTQEINSRRSLDLAKSKLLTGNDTVSARELYGKQTTFRPSWKVYMITNSRPNADANDFGIWRRLILLPFEYSFIEKPTGQNERLIDYDLPEKLKPEYPGVLAWAVQGCLKWQTEGLTPPDRVKAATSDYRSENDTIQQFISDACLVMPGVRIKPTELYQGYQKFCTDEGFTPESQTTFSRLMKVKFKTERTPTARWFIGITTKSDDAQ